MVSFDSMNEGFGVNRAVGSKRFRVSVKTEGGHSFNAFGKRNAIAHLANLICALEKVPLPKGGKTTYNFGEISGGTSVNTIAQSAEMLYEIRSDNGESLAFMHEFFEKTVTAHQASDAVITVTSVGERPCGRMVDPVLQSALEERARVGYRRFYGKEVSFVSGSTDCNIPLSCGIPALCVGCCHGKGAHTREEYVEKRSLLPGLKLCFHMVLADF
jgi:acetylornithine deacetylase/succinyl-diaminopimelate desuccinylase-like protein